MITSWCHKDLLAKWCSKAYLFFEIDPNWWSVRVYRCTCKIKFDLC